MVLTEHPRKRWTNNYENPYQKVSISNRLQSSAKLLQECINR